MTFTPRLAATLLWLAAIALPASPGFAQDADAAASKTEPTPPSILEDVRKGDRILFVGDQVTQQMFYDRAFAAAALALRPRAGIRVYNGGKDGATAADAADWIEDLVDLVEPRIVFLQFGLNEALREDDRQRALAAYIKGMEALLDKLRASESVRDIVILSPPPVLPQSGLDDRPAGVNAMLDGVTRAGYELARERELGFVNVFHHLRAVYLESLRVGGSPLVIGDVMPAEEAHVVLASVILKAMDAPADRLTRLGWTPLRPADMGRVRGALALPVERGKYAQARRSRHLYEAMRIPQERFFYTWRLAGKAPSRPTRRESMMETDQGWAGVERLVLDLYAETQKPGEDD